MQRGGNSVCDDCINDMGTHCRLHHAHHPKILGCYDHKAALPAPVIQHPPINQQSKKQIEFIVTDPETKKVIKYAKLP